MTSALRARGFGLKQAAGVDDGIEVIVGARAFPGGDEFPLGWVEGGGRTLDIDLLLAGDGYVFGGGIGGLITDHPERAADGDATGEFLDHGLEGAGDVDVEAKDEVEVVGFDGELGQVGAGPVDAVGDFWAEVLGHGAAVVEGLGGEINGGDLPAVCGEPEGFGAVSTAGVEGAAGAQFGSVGGEVGVWGASGNGLGVFAQGFGPEVFPEVLVVVWGRHRRFSPGVGFGCWIGVARRGCGEYLNSGGRGK